MFVTGNSGFPKSLDVSKALDKMAGAEREVVGFDEQKAKQQTKSIGTGDYGDFAGSTGNITAPATEAARQWQGWGTALKPALEPIILARKPLIGTVAQNVLAHGTGGLNIDGCRVGTQENLNGGAYAKDGGRSESQSLHKGSGMNQAGKTVGKDFEQPSGRWPANFIHDGSEEVVGLFPVTKSGGGDRNGAQQGETFHGVGDTGIPRSFPASEGSAARFFQCCPYTEDDAEAARLFYCAKTSKQDRDEGCEGMPDKEWAEDGACIPERENRPFNPSKNNHPTVKPTALMRYLCRLVTPPGGTVLDPFCGSGSTGKAAVPEGFDFIGIDIGADNIAIAAARIGKARENFRK